MSPFGLYYTAGRILSVYFISVYVSVTGINIYIKNNKFHQYTGDTCISYWNSYVEFVKG